MSSPIAACGPEKVLTKPILIGVWAIAGAAKSQRRNCCGTKQSDFHGSSLPVVIPSPDDGIKAENA